jgi:hypothetical protein
MWGLFIRPTAFFNEQDNVFFFSLVSLVVRNYILIMQCNVPIKCVKFTGKGNAYFISCIKLFRNTIDNNFILYWYNVLNFVFSIQ